MDEKVVPVDQNLNSVLQIGTFAFPFTLFYDDLDHYFNGFVNWHQQTQIEISVMLEGSAEVQVFEQQELVSEGDAFIILPENVHTVQMGQSGKSRYFTLVFDPVLLYGYKGSFFYEQYYLPSRQHGAPFHRIDHHAEWAQTVFEHLYWIYEHYAGSIPAVQLAITQRLQMIWSILCTNLFSTSTHKPAAITPGQQDRITALIQYLHEHYSEPFSLSELASQINVSRGECCRFFKKMLHITPSEYLMEYRLAKSMELLHSGHLSVTEIADLVGFSSPSYFIAQFRKKIGKTPLSYQREHANP